MTEKVKIHNHRRLAEGFLKLDRYSVSYDSYAGERLGPYEREVLERGDSVGVLIHDRRADTIVCVEQFRLPAFLRERNAGWIQETVAGVVGENERAEDAARRETLEETGISIETLHRIGTFYPSVGGSTERVTLFVAEADLSDFSKNATAGIKDEGEDIRVVLTTGRELVTKALNGEIRDAKLMICATWLAART